MKTSEFRQATHKIVGQVQESELFNHQGAATIFERSDKDELLSLFYVILRQDLPVGFGMSVERSQLREYVSSTDVSQTNLKTEALILFPFEKVLFTLNECVHAR